MDERRRLLATGIDRLKRIHNAPYILQLCERLQSVLNDGIDLDECHELLFKALLEPPYTLVIFESFNRIIMEILIDNTQNQHLPSQSMFNSEKQIIHLQYCLTLSKLIYFHPDVLPLSLKYFHRHPSPFEWPSNEEVSKRRKFHLDSERNSIDDYDIVECSYIFLKTAPQFFGAKWNWSIFINLFLSNDNQRIRWTVCDCIRILTGMSELQSDNLKKSIIHDSQIIQHCTSNYDDKMTNSNFKYLNISTNPGEKVNTFSDHIVDVSGILLPVHDLSLRREGILVPVKSTLDNLRSLALAVVSEKAACLTGPVGCGKTSLVEHLAALTGRSQTHLKKIQLGDQTDSRTLLGTFRCTDIPGEFVWQPGVLTEAVQQGHWLLLEDIDCAAIDVASVLSSLLERKVLSVPGYRDSIPIAPGFQLFLTRRTMTSVSNKNNVNVITLLDKHWIQINIEPLSQQELISVVNTLYPKLQTISSKMIDVFMLFSLGDHDSSLQNISDSTQSSHLIKTLDLKAPGVYSHQSGRFTSTRDLLKWCARAVVDFNVSSSESALKVLQDAIDIFACSLPDSNSRLALAKTIGAFLGIVETKAEYLCSAYKPLINLNPNSFQIGRAVVPKKHLSLSDVQLNEKKVTFSFTRPSACLLERISCCVNMKEPVLLVGETGTGKTSSIQYLARETGHKLTVINMNQQSDSADLLGGYKPVDLKYIISPIKNEFECLFRTYFNGIKNAKFLEHVSNTFYQNKWDFLLQLMKHGYMNAINRLNNSAEILAVSHKRKSSDDDQKSNLKNEWLRFGKKLEKLEMQIKAKASLAFSFIEGSLIKALKEGHWVLLDEINLASAETLECLSGLLEDQNNSINLIERGDNEPIKRHKDFTLFACMNPATDVGKRDLPVGLRNRFTEFYIDELADKNDLILLINDYLKNMSIDKAIVQSIYEFYVSIRKEAHIKLMDGTGQSPHYSLRTLCRALAAAPNAFCGTVTRSLYETMCLSFLTQLDSNSHPKVESMIMRAILGKKTLKSVMHVPIPMPKSNINENFINIEGYWVCKGSLNPQTPENYILTSSVRKNLKDLVRIISLGKLPILLQGDTSVGKTSLISYLAKITGNTCVRINNHQHTDLQEYVGSYASDSNGQLIFKEGVLVQAMRNGHWIILDELNLAPSEVLEALNRVLDDNKELFIPETQQVIKADPKFILFATQNPPGLYGGRKLLSRAFRNRFVELHFDEIPKNELEEILHKRCHMPLSYCQKVLLVMTNLQTRRKGSAAVQGKEGFITLRDLFRWGERYKIASNHDTLIGKYYDWDQHIADEGYLVLAGRVRKADERYIIQEVLEKYIKRKVEPENLFSLHEKTSMVTRFLLEEILHSKLDEFDHLVWTFNMRRLAVLVAKCFFFKEPVLLVGETGCGKTTICQVLSAVRKCKLTSINCHMHTESSDFLGGLRPVRNHNDEGKLFEWVDGPLTESMKSGGLFLADEISLADDSVLERLNSLLEPERQIYLAEKGISADGDFTNMIQAVDDFRFIATMNPGGDYGKKELSPALRNRFTEIWCDDISSRNDLMMVLEKSLHSNINQNKENFDLCSSILNFVDWFKKSKVGHKFPCTIRDLLSWIFFINETISIHNFKLDESFLHGANLVFLDCLGTSSTGSETLLELNEIKSDAKKFLFSQFKNIEPNQIKKIKNIITPIENFKFSIEIKDGIFGFYPFYIECGKHLNDCEEINFNFTVSTTGLNTQRVLRGLQLKKPILLEGSPGVGKTSLISALAKASGHKILRINLSDQTDVSDLFGADLPTSEGTFAWKEGAFLTALRNGDWILLDELNLAPQPVLEGLNACLDHRGEIFIPELCRTFSVKTGTRIFACQNPLRQGGARRGLPKSFLNRFTQVYIDTLTSDDLLFIIQTQYPFIPRKLLVNMVELNSRILKETTEHMWGYKGSPWELNLRDILRWCDGIKYDFDKTCEYPNFKPGKYAKLLYVDRMRSKEDKAHVKRIYEEIFGPEYPIGKENPSFYLTKHILHIGDSKLKRNTHEINKNITQDKGLLILRNQMPVLKSLMECIQMNWLGILIGPASSGKSSCIQAIAQVLGVELKILPVTSAMDTSDLLGGFEQADYNRHLEELQNKLETVMMVSVQNLFLEKNVLKATSVMREWELVKCLDIQDPNSRQTDAIEMKKFVKKIEQYKIITKLLKDINIHNDREMRRICEIDTMIQNVSEIVEKEKRFCNGGGKFEWVDSLLVKCLLNGSWLLIDNVNLCSSAVLDRLNGLLEQNGVLTIPERGDSINEIKPHPNFRMFFTMDPKNGEISRAMRNRGVEIYIIDSEETKTESFTDFLPLLDLQALIKSTGLPSSFSDIFLSCHNEMSSFYESYEKPTKHHFLQSAFLTFQQVSRGEPIGNAIINSFSDIYIKSFMSTNSSINKGSIAEIKNKMLKIMHDIVNLYVQNEKNLKVTLMSNHTFSCLPLSQNSRLEKIKQDSYLFSFSLNNGCKNVSSLSLMIYAIYNESTLEDIQLRHQYIKNIILNYANSNISSFCCALNDSLFGTTQEEIKKATCNPEYPWNGDFFTEVENDINFTNRLCGFLYYLTARLQRNFNSSEPEGNMSIYQYSKNVLSGIVTDEFMHCPLLKHSSILLNEIDHLVTDVLMNSNMKIPLTLWSDLIVKFSWLNRFFTASRSSLFEDILTNAKTKRILNQRSVNNLILHYKWVIKQLYLPMQQLCSLYKSTPDTSNMIDSINSSIATTNSPFKSISKHLKRNLGEATLYPTEKTYLLCLKRDKILDGSTISKILSKNFHPIDILLTTKKLDMDLNIRNVFGHPDDSETIKAENEDTKMEIEDESAKQSDSTIDLAESVCAFSYSTQLWPIQDWILRKIIHVFMLKLFKELNHFKCNSNLLIETIDLSKFLPALDHLSYAPSFIKFLPPKLQFLFSNAMLLKENNAELIYNFKQHMMEIWNLVSEYEEMSPSANAQYWLCFNERTLDDQNTDTNNKLLPFHFPYITYGVMKLTVNTDLVRGGHFESDLSTTTLSGWKYRTLQLQSLQDDLWKNMIISSSPELNKLYLNMQTIVINFERFVVNLEHSILKKDQSDVSLSNLDSSPDLIQNTVRNCIDHINNLYKEKNKHFTFEMITLKNEFVDNLNNCLQIYHIFMKNIHDMKNNLNQLKSMNDENEFHFMILIGKMWTMYSMCNVFIFSEIGTVDIVEKDQLKMDYLQEDIKTFESFLGLALFQSLLQGTTCIQNDIVKNLLEDHSLNNDSGFMEKLDESKRNNLCKINDRSEVLLSNWKHATNKLDKLAKGKIYRPREPSYLELSKEFSYFKNTLGSFKQLASQYQNMLKAYGQLAEILESKKTSIDTNEKFQNAGNSIKKFNMWKYSVKNFYQKTSKKFTPTFPDIIKPFLNYITQVVFGLSLIKECLMKMMFTINYGMCNPMSSINYCETLVRFPILGKNCESSLNIVDSISSINFMNFLNKINSMRDVVKPDAEENEMYSIYKINLQELYCKIVSDNCLDSDTWSILEAILEELVCLWQKMEKMIEKEKQEEDSLYTTRVKCDDPSKEEQNEEEISAMFPSFTDVDFSDFKPMSSDRKNVKTNEKVTKKWDRFFTQRDMELITAIHSNIVQYFTTAEWLPKSTGNKLQCDYISPLIERYKILGSYLDDIHYGLKESLDSKILPSLALLTAHARSFVDGEDYIENNNNLLCPDVDKLNFYLSPWVQESKKCLPVLESIKTRTLSLLEQWPDFPTLKDILVVINRVMEFPVTSPVARFLTGLELLRDKMEEWNKSAHSKNNLNDLAKVVAHQIVSWRKLELNGWKDSLNNVYYRLKLKANKWWFHIYVLVNCYVFEKPLEDGNQIFVNETSEGKGANNMTSQAFITAMQQFMERSPLVEFKKRLEILYTFHCHAVHMQPSKKRDEIISILWNVHKYYSQYASHVSQVIKDKRSPIEKKLKDFVKITSWDRDLSYWSVKDLVFKSQKVLHKHMKEFEEVLQIPASSFLVCDKTDEKINSIGLWDRPKRSMVIKSASHYMIDVNSFLISPRWQKKYFVENEVEESHSTKSISRLKSLTTKAKDLCKTAITNSHHPHLIQELDETTTQIIERVAYLKSLEVDANLSKEKKKSAAKNHLQQKRKALSDLFRTLSEIGISFKAGLAENSIRKSQVLDFNLPPVDLEPAFSYLKNKRCDSTLLTFWKDCDSYYQRCVSRMGHLNVALLKPANDLGPPNIERIKGFAIHYMLLVQEQKLKISKFTRKLCNLRHRIGQITDLCEFYEPLPDQSSLISHCKSLNDIYSMTIMTMQQFALLLNSYPNSRNTEGTIMFDNAIQNDCMSGIQKDNPSWKYVHDKVKIIINIAQKQKDNINKINTFLPSVIGQNRNKNEFIIYLSNVDTMKTAFKCLGDIRFDICNLIKKYNFNSENHITFENPATNSLVELNRQMAKVINHLEPIFDNVHSHAKSGSELLFFNSTEEYTTEVEKLINEILLIIQIIYKKYSEKCIVTDEASSDEIPSHLKKELLKNIEGSLTDFHMSQLNYKISLLISRIKDSIIEEEIITSKRLLAKCLPLLEQISLLAQFFVTQHVSAYRVSCKMLSIILNIFSELCQKGFCTPEDVSEEASEEKGQGKLAGGTGLADGEGEKDVSDQIENQDQLDDARKAGEEKNKEDDKDCKEEASGIEMTDDFESHLQDLQNDDVDEKDESDEDDIDKQMGETEEGAEKLDEQLWGSDNEDEVDDTNDSKKENKGSGVPLGEKNMEAKQDEDDSGNEESHDDDKKKNKKDINEMEEQDYDDDQVDPYHGNQKPMPEPEPLELPDETNINEDEENDDQEEDSKNPFDIDVMKDKKSVDENKENEKSDSTEKEAEENQNSESAIEKDSLGSSDSEDDNQNEDNDDDKFKEDKDDIDDPDNVEEDEEKSEINDTENKDQNDKTNMESESPKIQNVDEIDEKQQADAQNEDEKQPETDPIEHLDNKPSSEDQIENNEIQEKGSKDSVQTNPNIEKKEDSAPFEQCQEQVGDDKEGFGQSELSEDQQGHLGNRTDKPQSSKDKNNKDAKKPSDKRNRPGEVDENRILGEIKEPVQKKMKTLNMENDKTQNEEEDDGFGENDQSEADFYQHIKQVSKDDSQVLDAATQEQAEKQPVPNKDDETPEDEDVDPNVDMDTSEDIKINDDDPDKKMEPEKCGKDQKNNETKSKSGNQQNEDIADDMGVEIEGENVLTLGVDRNIQTHYQTKLDILQASYCNFEKSTITEASLHEALQSVGPDRSSNENNKAWQTLWNRTSTQARLLTEKLRLVLEPTGLSRLAGDYRTGKRLNMRKVIPYIASEFRKDRIWLRRTKPARREYQIAIAIDDSSSMSDNQSKELAFESLALISQGLNYLEAGDLAVVSFGENTKIIHPFNEPFTESSGSRVMQNLTFDQTKTSIAQMLDFTSIMFERLSSSSNTPNAKLLLIVSDGRGIFSEGENKVLQSVRKMRQQGIFMVYLIVDNPENMSSIMDIVSPVFDKETGAYKHALRYMDSFPFPFYLILRDIATLPTVLCDAMRQWFELTANMDKN